MEPKALLVDVGNVLMNFDHRAMCRELAAYTALTPEEVYKRVYTGGLERSFDRGEYTRQAFFKEAMRVLEGHCTYEAFARVWDNQLKNEITTTADILARLEATGRYRLVLISNTDPLVFDRFAQCGFMRFFPPEKRALSYEVRARKGDGDKLFRVAVEKAGCGIEACVLVDDILEYVEAFRRLGGKGIPYQNTGDMVRDGKRLEADLRALGFRF
ncbi:hypothetical protein HYS48_01200 [Candidatus Woesearchaeota archaeon]|nr:hypothetical protein [Candidatus Woesearchaeota archaeon]